MNILNLNLVLFSERAEELAKFYASILEVDIEVIDLQNLPKIYKCGEFITIQQGCRENYPNSFTFKVNSLLQMKKHLQSLDIPIEHGEAGGFFFIYDLDSNRIGFIE